MPEAAPAARTISPKDLHGFIARVLGACGFPDADAARVADLMTEADVRGSDGHGVFRLPMYVKRIRSGGINVRPRIRIIKERKAQALLDGDNAMGHLVMARAAEIAIAKAKETGVAWVGSRNSNHAGPAALYAQMPLAHDMIGLYAAVGNGNHVPPWGGVDLLLSTNPIAIAIPGAKRPPIVLDMATTTAAYGKVKMAQQRGEEMPVGWMVDRQGNPLTDPNRASEGFLMPIGGPKGYGLALMLGLLAGTLNGAAMGKDVVDFTTDHVTPTNTGQFIAALDIAAFADVAEFKADVDDIYEQMKGSATMGGFSEVRVPGESAWSIARTRRDSGVPLPPELVKALDAVAKEVGVASL
jgi:LDH2 family malate/lactate/ureidoglycolate dehydrogenase